MLFPELVVKASFIRLEPHSERPFQESDGGSNDYYD
jgi:hypothetical protein